MARFFKKRSQNKGAVPGSLIFIGQQKMKDVRISVMDYNKDGYTEAEFDNIEDAVQHTQNNTTVTWINIEGLHDTSFIEKVGDHFNIHVLLLEDILNTGQRSKFEAIEDYVFITLKMLDLDESEDTEVLNISSEQVSIIVKDNFLITFQEQTGDVFDSIRDRIRNKRGRVCTSGTDYLAYILLDSIVDNYNYLIEELGQSIEDIELNILDSPDQEVLEHINKYKRELNFMSKIVRPARETINNFARTDNDNLKRKTRPYLRDLQDMTTHAIETIDTYRVLLSDYLHIYHTNVSHRLNDIMRVLTIFSAIFIPLTFIAGVYGANFEYMPELSYKYGYLIFWCVLITVALSLLLFFRRKKWL